MLVKILGGIDLLAGSVLIFGSSTETLTSLFGFLGIVMIIKSFIRFLKDLGSWIDFIVGIVFLVSIPLPIPGIIKIIVGILVLQKGIVSFL